MNKSQIIINGIRATEFVLVRKYDRYILNNLIAIHFAENDNIKPNHRPWVELPATEFKYAIGEKIFDSEIIWRGYYIGFLFNFSKYHIYVDVEYQVQLEPI